MTPAKAAVLAAPHAAPADNLLLRALPADLQQSLRARLESVPLRRGQRLFSLGEPVSHVYFPTAGMISLEFLAPDGGTLELAAIGRDGMIGVPVLWHGAAAHAAVVRADGRAYRIANAPLAAELRQRAELHEALLRYTGTMFDRMTQIAHCHYAHTVLQRLCRWLLTAGDLLDSSTIAITHEELAGLLGIARQIVGRGLGELQHADAIWRRQGRILIHQRARLEHTACECYRLLKSPTGV